MTALSFSSGYLSQNYNWYQFNNLEWENCKLSQFFVQRFYSKIKYTLKYAHTHKNILKIKLLTSNRKDFIGGDA